MQHDICPVCGKHPSAHTMFDWKCKSTGQISMRAESAAKVGGQRSAETKRRRGQELMPRINLQGSLPRNWKPAPLVDPGPVNVALDRHSRNQADEDKTARIANKTVTRRA